MNDVMWLVYACLAVVSVFAVPAAIACGVDALFQSSRATNASAGMRR